MEGKCVETTLREAPRANGQWSTRTIAGYAAVKGMCTEKRSCTINEGLDFGSVFVVTHEMGHSLGMYHDGDNRCDLRCCIMSPSVGSGKTSWSECSVRELNNFVTQLGQEGRPANCLVDGTHPVDGPPLNVPSGQEFTLDEQCAFFHGECWRHELKEGQKLSDVCDMVWCGNGEGIVRSAHPALQGSFCGEQKWCMEGKCVETTLREAPRANGQWSAWSDVGSRSCSIGCVQCSIAGQIRVRRSSRHCNLNSLLKGIWSSWSSWGDCAAIHCRKLGIRVRQRSCMSGVCAGANRQRSTCFVPCGHPHDATIPKTKQIPHNVTAQHYTNMQRLHAPHVANASHNVGAQYSTNVAHDKHISTRSSTSFLHATNIRHGAGVLHTETASRGGGLPRGAHAAHGTSTQHTADVRNSRILLPQGTKSRHITTVRSNGKNVAYSQNVPHRESVPTATVAIHSASVPQTANTLRRTIAHVTTALKSHPGNVDKVSHRPQTATINSGAQQSPWSAWSVCSVSCGYGTQSRIKNCTQCEKPTWEVRRCFSKECEAEWTQWGEWGSCDATCGYSNRYRRRRCVGNTCKGSAVSVMQCRVPPCAGVSVKTVIGFSQHLRLHAPMWSAWSSWSACSATCGGGISRRVRVCSLNRRCVGISSDKRICKTPPCLSKPLRK
uniref:A disintegrin and metalloproteinase with thrombospondin motifs 3 n=1 Tax=Ascaris suum TaxID=6253 RepID=F1KZ96_ASCSU